mmetsp:Transcript_36514/g.53550  ORF Transcript_36514/g.53550 Transcript_36514/m.53550 type:complete len:398 (+) Transcript_36514:50-1243(+)|eukprot:CAMPEP_0195516926 /NCGR_PEP_ID=MMETSP0794_2-20130614/9169_1 /TAXON_ID=515487 /ORGANISM="Stephanopyxis turris, Strain CCMP 815" /LENGTH=397 /DNA_ID=CAMNT_0040645643 /DNA_START=31 /DNA_END=1224 /DNA_ORIENTATION=+
MTPIEITELHTRERCYSSSKKFQSTNQRNYRRQYIGYRALLWAALVVLPFIFLCDSNASIYARAGTGVAVATTASPSIPRSTNSRHAASQESLGSPAAMSAPYIPPWNPSRRIDERGFLVNLYRCIPGEWEEEANVGGRYSDLRKKSRFLFGVNRKKRVSSGGSKSKWKCRFVDGSETDDSDAEEENEEDKECLHADDDSDYLMCRVRQVPGDGNCLFHSVATCLSMAVNKTQVDMRNTTFLRQQSTMLREQAVECLRRRPRRILFLQGKECLRADELVEAASSQYNISSEEYCDLMQQDSYWGGGPEIVALCNVLRRPIHVYELSVGASKTTKKEFYLRRMACFGSPKFDRHEPLHILSADSRFPDVSPGKQLTSGNHFLALFPYASRDVGSEFND